MITLVLALNLSGINFSKGDGSITTASLRGAVARLSTQCSMLSGTSSNGDRGHHSETLAIAHSSPSISHLPLWIKKCQLKQLYSILLY